MKHEKEAIEREKRKLKELMQRAEASLQRSESTNTKRVQPEPVPFKLDLVVEHNSPERPISVRFVTKNSKSEFLSPETPTTSATLTTTVESDEDEQDDQMTESDITSPGESVTG